MGMEHRVHVPAGATASWGDIAARLAGAGYPVEMRMIDGQLAFPDEAPPADWRELRVGTPQGMVTVRREADGLAVVTWGNADDGLRRAWNALAWACAEATGGLILTDGTDRTPAAFRQGLPLPPGFGG